MNKHFGLLASLLTGLLCSIAFVQQAAAQPPNGLNGVPVLIDVNDSVLGNNALASSPGNEQPCAPSAHPVYYELHPLQAGVLSISLCADSMYGMVRVYGAFNELLGCSNTDGCPTASSDTRVYVLPVEACTPYQIEVAAAGPTPFIGGDFTLETSFAPSGAVSEYPVNDEVEGALPISSSAQLNIDMECATRSLRSPFLQREVDVWYYLDVNSAGDLDIHGCCDFSGTTDNIVTIYDDEMAQVGSLPVGGDQLQLTLPLPAAGRYYLRFTQPVGRTGPIALDIDFPEAPEGEPAGPDEGEGTQEEGEAPTGIDALYLSLTSVDIGGEIINLLSDSYIDVPVSIKVDGVPVYYEGIVIAETIAFVYIVMPPHAAGTATIHMEWADAERDFTVTYVDKTPEGAVDGEPLTGIDAYFIDPTTVSTDGGTVYLLTHEFENVSIAVPQAITLDGTAVFYEGTIGGEVVLNVLIALPPHAPGEATLRLVWGETERTFIITYADETPEGALEGEGAAEGFAEGSAEGEGDAAPPEIHSADTNADNIIGLAEVLRVIQFKNASALHCEAGTEDGYGVGSGNAACPYHSADYDTADWVISLGETLRVIQIYNSEGYSRCKDGEDGYCL